MNDGQQGAMIHTDITNHQKDSSNRSPLALSIKSTHTRSDETFFFTTLYSQNSILTSPAGHSQSTKLFSRVSAADAGHLDRVSISNTPLETSAEPKSPQTGWLQWIYEHNQLFKPRLFTDNLLTIQLFILRQRPSASHKQMKSNKAPRRLKDTESPLTLYYEDKYIYEYIS